MVQDTYLTVIKKADSYKGLGPLSAWLSRITINQALTLARKQKCEKDNLQRRASRDEDRKIPPEILASNETVAFIHEAIDRLTPRHQEILNLTLFAAATTSQVAEHLGIRPSDVRFLLFRAKSCLRRELEYLLRERPSG